MHHASPPVTHSTCLTTKAVIVNNGATDAAFSSGSSSPGAHDWLIVLRKGAQ